MISWRAGSLVAFRCFSAPPQNFIKSERHGKIVTNARRFHYRHLTLFYIFVLSVVRVGAIVSAGPIAERTVAVTGEQPDDKQNRNYRSDVSDLACGFGETTRGIRFLFPERRERDNGLSSKIGRLNVDMDSTVMGATEDSALGPENRLGFISNCGVGVAENW